ncbi:MAG: alkaline phosphatase family protein [Caldilineaceae bacterium]
MQTTTVPAYGHGCFADLPATIQHCLSGSALPAGCGASWGDFLQRYDRVITILADGFGWRFFERHRQMPASQRFIQQGKALRWTSQFPSTTAAHITCIHTGLTPGESGVHEWQYYDPAVGSIITPLLFSFGGTTKRDLLKNLQIAPQAIYPQEETIYQSLAKAGVQSHIYGPAEFTPSTYSDWLNRGAVSYGYESIAEALTSLRIQVEQTVDPAYFYLYFPKIDSLGHTNGPNSAQFDAEIQMFLYCLEEMILRPLTGKAKKTLLILTADHGQDTITPERCVFVNRDARFVGVERFIKRNEHGHLLVPGGSARDMFVYIHEHLLDEAVEFFASRLDGFATVYKTQELIDKHYFGPTAPSQRFLERVANLLILPHEGESIWWYEEGSKGMPFWGHHGGLTPQEMEIPVCLYGFE